MDFYGFYTGKIFNAYEYLGAHKEGDKFVFRTFAPSAASISIIGEFNNWQETKMNKVHDGNFWEVYIGNASEGMMYKYKIYERNGAVVEHCDPYGFGMELRPNFASIIRDISKFKFTDEKWMKKRTDCKDKPMNIYELHFGSWRKKSEKQEDWYSYTELSELLIPYLIENGYNYLEILPLSEHPCDESWGYQNTGFYSPTSRYGTADELKEFVNKCHNNGIGVIMDFVPVHFAIDYYALGNYDGTPLYEYPNSDVGNSEWGSYNFMHSRGEVRSFLQSLAHYWLELYHIDGLRMDAISNLIYWQGDPNRGVNGNAIDFLKYMNKGIKELHPTSILIAEDSTAFPKVTKPVEEDGLGFDYKWDMGWMNDTLEFLKTHPYDREEAYHKITFSMHYFYSENFLLPLSHDEVVHGKGTIIDKMNGEYEDKFKQVKELYMYMYTHPGKKLNFMGNELGHFREWDEKREIDWSLLEYPIHKEFHEYMKKLNDIYIKTPALYAMDYKEEGFKWLDCHQEEKGIYVYIRRSGGEEILSIFNFSNKEQENYKVKIEKCSSLSLMLGTESYFDNNIVVEDEAIFNLKPFSSAIYKIQGRKKEK